MERPSPAVQDYLKAIYQLTEAGQDADGVIGTSQVAQALSVTTASASNMLKRLDALGYVSQVKRQGAALTDLGRRAALEVVRHHRILETYLATRLGLSWDEVHAEAEVLEHHVSPALAERMAEVMGHPDRDPHGHPIPSAAGVVARSAARRLSELAVGERATVVSVDDRDDELLRFLADRGLVPGAAVEVRAVGPFGGPIDLRVTGREQVAVPPTAASAVHVTPIEDAGRHSAS
ncbi:MAG TPA: metal-dependent transcriptional regulator [Miltoncostaeaceae bacterium]|nr:metal-dependent transcriptional regulator [Miltoncostaeaceae bacterium]